MQDGCRVYMDVFQHGIKWIMFHDHLDCFRNNMFLMVGLTEHRETMASRMLTTVGLFYFIMCEDPHDRNSLK